MDAFDALRDKFRRDMNEYTDDLANGVANWDAYQRLVGRIEGLAIAERHLLDLKEKIEEQ